MNNLIKIRGAKTHNLKNISLDLPKNKLIVITGLSGSGKSSLAFDTIYAEGQRLYVESLSAYARQFVGLMDKPPVDKIEGLSPAIAIDQRTVSNNPRSTVGTITEIYDYLRLLFARVGVPHCHLCGRKMVKKLKEEEEKKKNNYHYYCRTCDNYLEKLEPKNFSFNSSYGACLHCSGLGYQLSIDPNLLWNKNLSILEGGIRPLTKLNIGGQKKILDEIEKLAQRNEIKIQKKIEDLNSEEVNIIINGDKKWPGLAHDLLQKHNETKSPYVKQELEKYLAQIDCQVCMGRKLQKKYLSIKFKAYNINEICDLTINDLQLKLKNILKTDFSYKNITQPILEEILINLEYLNMLGLDYLTLNRSSASLSGGESQRIRLALQVGSKLSGVIYVLDEPSIGLHSRDNKKLIKILKNLRDNNNTVIVVEHDEEMIKAADHLVDIGPKAGENGGSLIYSGHYSGILKNKDSITGAYLNGNLKIKVKKEYRSGNNKAISIIGASENNLKNINVDIPLAKLVAITGVSGSGKSTLVNDILSKALSAQFYKAKSRPGRYKKLLGVNNINKLISIDQSPIGKTPRSNPATYTGLFTYIRDIFSQLPEAKAKNFSPGHFSFNVEGGRCEECGGDGVIKVEMQFLTDVYLTCELCQGKRFKKKILNIKYKNKNIYDVLNMTVAQALNFFKSEKIIVKKLQTLVEVGLSYIKLGQAANTFSGGEAQRIKLATELSRKSTGKTLYILDEPSTGLHLDDISRLLKVLNMLVDQGNTVLMVEHNLDLIKSADYVIDLGPDGGEKGGFIVASGNPAEITQSKNSYTGQFLKKYF
jgi:excinuclease ABC subunit A